MKKEVKNTFDEWLNFIQHSKAEFKEIIQEKYRDVDITELMPSLTLLKSKNIKIINAPYFINHKGIDELKSRYIEIEDLEEELENLTHIYSIRLTRSINNPDIFENKNALLVRGVRKELDK